MMNPSAGDARTQEPLTADLYELGLKQGDAARESAVSGEDVRGSGHRL